MWCLCYSRPALGLEMRNIRYLSYFLFNRELDLFCCSKSSENRQVKSWIYWTNPPRTQSRSISVPVACIFEPSIAGLSSAVHNISRSVLSINWPVLSTKADVISLHHSLKKFQAPCIIWTHSLVLWILSSDREVTSRRIVWWETLWGTR